MKIQHPSPSRLYPFDLLLSLQARDQASRLDRNAVPTAADCTKPIIVYIREKHTQGNKPKKEGEREKVSTTSATLFVVGGRPRQFHVSSEGDTHKHQSLAMFAPLTLPDFQTSVTSVMDETSA